MKTLDQIMCAHGTDKATVFTRTYAKPKGFSLIYGHLFENLRHYCSKFLEVGVAGGESIKAWLEYFDRAHVYGVDIVKDTNPWNTVGEKPDVRYTFVQGPQESETFWACFIADHGKEWEIIVDDGSHMADGIITTFQALWPYVSPNGFYCIEDLGVASSPGTVFVPNGWPNHMDWLKDKLHFMNRGNGDIEYMCYWPELAVFKKKGPI